MLWKESFQFCGKNVSNWKDSFQLKKDEIPSQCGFSHWHDTCFYVGEAKEVLEAQLFCLLQDQDREIVDLLLDELKPKEIAEMILSTPEAVQKRWERIRKWLIPIARNLEDLVDCLPEENDRKIMERYLEEQPLSEITKALGISCSTIEETVKRVIADWKKAAKDNPTDPVSAMVKKRR